MRILISGASGLVGSALIPQLEKQGHTIARLVRRVAKTQENEIYWDPERGSLDKAPLQEFKPEAVVHLAGESIAEGRWTDAKKKRIRDSRVNGTRILAQALASLEPKPKVWISGSAIGYYGDRADEILNEKSAAGHNFLAEVCQEWEAETKVAEQASIRVAHLRTGVVLSRHGGALKKLLLPFKLGAGGVIGNGRQYMSWIALEDLVGIIQFLLTQDQIQGAVNAVAPQPVTNREFTKTLGRVLWRPTLLPLPASTARLVLGEMADELLLSSARVQPSVLESAGYAFKFPKLKEALKHVLSDR